MRFPRRNAALPQVFEHGAGVDSEPLAHPGERQAGLVEADHLLDLVCRCRGAAELDAVSFEDFADGGAVTLVVCGKLVDGHAFSIAVDDLLLGGVRDLA